jgi:hypothetical protein
MLNRHDLVDASGKELAHLMATGHPFDPAALGGWIYHGTSLGLPGWIERLFWKKFAKVFHRDAGSDRLRGWNMRIVQDGIDRPWRPMEKRGKAVTFGHFDVVGEPGAVILDYGPRGGPTLRALRDPLVSLEAGSTEVLLGRSLLDLRIKTVGTPSYFILERGARLPPDLVRY